MNEIHSAQSNEGDVSRTQRQEELMASATINLLRFLIKPN